MTLLRLLLEVGLQLVERVELADVLGELVVQQRQLLHLELVQRALEDSGLAL